MVKDSYRGKFKTTCNKVKTFPTGPGLYFMKDQDNKVLYIGKAKNLRSRIASYFQKTSDIIHSRSPKIAEMLSKVSSIDFLQTPSEVEAVLSEARLIKDIHPPYNTDLVDDKTFPYLEITTGEDFPGVYITRKPHAKGSRLLGPFTSAKDLRATLTVLQKIFKFRTCRLEIYKNDRKRRFFRPCLLYSIKQCAAPCADKITARRYRRLISDLVRFLGSKHATVLKELKQRMHQASQAMDYEVAAMLRDRIRLIERLDQRGSPEQNIQPEAFASDPTEALVQIQGLLGASEPVRIIEGIDIAHISGCEAVGSLVKFIDGRPFKSGYRHFRIKSVQGVDDYAMIAEVVTRRYKYALSGEEIWPDLILIDGGIGQLNAAQAAFRQLTHRYAASRAPSQKTTIAAIAKKQEHIYLQGSTKPLKLAANSPARKLLQYIRDEAHRFAQYYHHILRSRQVPKK